MHCLQSCCCCCYSAGSACTTRDASCWAGIHTGCACEPRSRGRYRWAQCLRCGRCDAILCASLVLHPGGMCEGAYMDRRPAGCRPGRLAIAVGVEPSSLLSDASWDAFLRCTRPERAAGLSRGGEEEEFRTLSTGSAQKTFRWYRGGCP